MGKRGRAHHDVVCELLQRFAGQDVIRVAEIGVWTGNLSKRLLTEFPNLFLTMIDLWTFLPEGHRDYEEGFSDPRKLERAKRAAIEKTNFAGNRRLWYQTTSHNAARSFTPGLFDLVFIDGGHSTETVAADIRDYWPLVCSDGILSGHDYRTLRSKYTVRRAVDAWVAENDKQLHLHNWWVWHVEKD